MSPVEGAGNQLWAATCPVERARQLSGEYIVPFQQVGVPRPDLNDVDKVNRLWTFMEEEESKHV